MTGLAYEALEAFFAGISGVAHAPKVTSLSVASIEGFLSDVNRIRTRTAVLNAPDDSEQTTLDLHNRLEDFLPSLNLQVDRAKSQGHFVNVWEVAQLRRDELRNASVLAWILNPSASHGRGAAVLNSLLSLLKERHSESFPLSLPLHGAYTVTTESCPFSDQSNRIDIAIDGDDFFIFVEVKVDASEGVGQLSRYLDVAAQKSAASAKESYAVVYISRFAKPTLSAKASRLVIATWIDVAQAIRATILASDERETDIIDLLFKQFAQHIIRL